MSKQVDEAWELYNMERGAAPGRGGGMEISALEIQEGMRDVVLCHMLAQGGCIGAGGHARAVQL